MRRQWIAVVVGLASLSGEARALELTWAGGAKNLNVTATAVCTLLVKPSGAETLLPGSWRLVYVGSANVEPALVFLEGAGPSGAAPACAVTGPATDAERLSKQTTVQFCGPGDGAPTALAAFLVSVDASFEGRIAAVPVSDMSRSTDPTIDALCEVTINGGTFRSYPASLWTARRAPDSTGADQVVLSGVGLDHVETVVIQPGGDSGALPSGSADTLEILARGPGYIAARPHAPAQPEQLLVLGNGTGNAAAATSLDTQSPAPYGLLRPLMIPGGSVRPKDFAFIHARGQYHLFYIRHDDLLPDSSTEVDLGHAVSTNLYGWTQLPPVLHVRPGKWDDRHVWAPTIIERDSVFYMFYTGVTRIPAFGTEYQRIGVATSTDLLEWTRYDDPVFGGNWVPWAFADSSQWHGCQFRDPFVMTDPADPTKWLIYDVATPEIQPTQTIVGVGRNAGGLSAWADVLPFWNTDSLRYLGHCESPHVFWHDPYWYLVLTGTGHPLQVEYALDPVADSSGWAGSWGIWRILGNDPTTDSWYASEHLAVGGHEYFAFVNYVERGIEIREMVWGPPPTWGAMPSFTLSNPPVTAVDDPGREAGAGVSLRVGGGARSGFSLRLGLPATMNARIEVFDVSGRKVKRVRDGRFPAGVTVVPWDARGREGAPVPNGVYFARLTTPAGSRSAKLVVLR